MDWHILAIMGTFLPKQFHLQSLKNFELLTILNTCALSALQSFAIDNQQSQGKSPLTLDQNIPCFLKSLLADFNLVCKSGCYTDSLFQFVQYEMSIQKIWGTNSYL